ncbi:hypothetical protein KZX45_08790 [Georgenia sp. EYE_87]|uniref:hypothetical protein n=1 Tax=Georgenia sp. EYE_87 TaxID=2853448 RepID=UPI002004B3A4|nr:hypothetical protein [Georgenia sp. EYE_87]MCK6210635.1 hypothetical protein [Georgenia sp. EYE_87]
MRTTRNSRAVRGIFILVLTGFVAQVAVDEMWREPYPGLFQPGFGGIGPVAGTVDSDEPTVTVVYTDGGSATFTHLEVMAQAKSSPTRIFSTAFRPDSPRRDLPGTVAWLERRVSDLGGGREPVRAVISWRTAHYDLDDDGPPRFTVGDRTVVPFGGRDE